MTAHLCHILVLSKINHFTGDSTSNIFLFRIVNYETGEYN